MKDTKLIFVYNAESGVANALKDFVQKSFQPETYACNLCALTYPVAWKDPRWKQFLKSLPVEVEFEYRDTLAEKYQIEDVPLPVVFQQDDTGELVVWMEAETINEIDQLDQLIIAVRSRLEAGEPAPV